MHNPIFRVLVTKSNSIIYMHPKMTTRKKNSSNKRQSQRDSNNKNIRCPWLIIFKSYPIWVAAHSPTCTRSDPRRMVNCTPLKEIVGSSVASEIEKRHSRKCDACNNFNPKHPNPRMFYDFFKHGKKMDTFSVKPNCVVAIRVENSSTRSGPTGRWRGLDIRASRTIDSFLYLLSSKSYTIPLLDWRTYTNTE